MKTEYYLEHCHGIAGGPKKIIRPLSGQVNLALTFNVDYFIYKAFAHFALNKALQVTVKVLEPQAKGPRIRLVTYNYVRSGESSSMPYSYFGPLRRALAFKNRV